VNGELERKLKEAVVAKCKVLSRHLPGWIEKTTKNFSQDSRYWYANRLLAVRGNCVAI
jgi:hypothetical protein